LVTHPVMTAINTRVLRPGSNQETAKLLDLIRLWHEEEERLGIEIDARVFAYVVSNDDQLDRALLHLGLAAEPVELGFLQVYPQVEGAQRHPRGFAVRLRVREAVQ
jgi:hypothetical protein